MFITHGLKTVGWRELGTRGGWSQEVNREKMRSYVILPIVKNYF